MGVGEFLLTLILALMTWHWGTIVVSYKCGLLGKNDKKDK